jgi:hypothetical protein
MRVEQVAPWLAVEARTERTFAEVVGGHTTHSSKHEGAYEVGGRMAGLPLGDPEHAVKWLLLKAEETTYSGVAAALLVLLPVLVAERGEAALPWVLELQREIAAMTPEQRVAATRRLTKVRYLDVID